MTMVNHLVPKDPQARMNIIGDRFGMVGSLVVFATMIVSIVVLLLLGF